MSEERRLKINQIRNNLDTLRTITEEFEVHIKELTEYNDPEGRDLSITMTALEQALYYLGQLNWRLTNVNRLIIPPPDHYESQLVTWTRQLQPLRPMNRDPLDRIPFFTWGQPAGDAPYERICPPAALVADVLYGEERIVVVQEPEPEDDHANVQALDKEDDEDSIFDSD
jgi:hypothetical protein